MSGDDGGKIAPEKTRSKGICVSKFFKKFLCTSQMARGQGFEPRLTGSEPVGLPLADPLMLLFYSIDLVYLSHGLGSPLPNLHPAKVSQLWDKSYQFRKQRECIKKAGRKVVLIDFWTYTRINCIRTLPYLKAWLWKKSCQCRPSYRWLWP